MRAHFAFTSNAVASQASDALRVVVVSSAPLVRSGLRTILGAFDDLDLTEADPTRLRIVNADVMLCDGTLPDDVDVPALVLVVDAAGAADALASGARGVLARTAAPRRMHAALHAVAEAEIVIDDAFADHLLRHPRAEVEMIEPLTAREREVLRLLASGLTNKEIAQRLGVTDHTIKFHVNGILGKLGAATRTEAVVEAARRGIIAV
ncbi:MAG: two-component system, NarL family, nitrate/nitrite response regulator NarL [Thermoanaerobaculia bacterium]|jgi:DNA-binding NarL/FixJ family response regulator|nr:two-component system, NarL family, nitrate/nitrite response regulator NarL [Thermoanaerobaculia bacterium]